MFVSCQNVLVEMRISKVMVIGGEAFGSGRGKEGRAFKSAMSTLIKAPENLLAPQPCADTEIRYYLLTRKWILIKH